MTDLGSVDQLVVAQLLLAGLPLDSLRCDFESLRQFRRGDLGAGGDQGRDSFPGLKLSGFFQNFSVQEYRKDLSYLKLAVSNEKLLLQLKGPFR